MTNDKNMPGGKKILKSRKTKKETPIQELENLVRKDDAQIRSELHYFRGLSIMITVLIVVVFFTFGCLFSALYWEVKGMSRSMQQYIEDTHEYLVTEFSEGDCSYQETTPAPLAPVDVPLE